MFGRPKQSEPTTATTEQLEESKVGGKGRPTPKRRSAEDARKKRMTPPRTRKEAAQRQRETTKAARLKTRSAMETGEERYLPPRDQGNVKRYVRNYVDSHRTVGQFLLPIFFVIFVLVFLNSPVAANVGSFAWIAVIIWIMVDSFRVLRGVKKGIASRFGADEAKGITMYALLRSWQMRRLRLPKPQVSPGDKI
ncbi:MAG: DUF3043 domain-containing protein [Nocardioidaceae bacterium]|nr:DUF3043 domain-containing protein [Nocardioidaceae bacterium]